MTLTLGFEAPCRFEGECFDLVVHGEIPKSINGTFYRVGPDPQVVPKYENVPRLAAIISYCRKSISMATEQSPRSESKTAMSTSEIDSFVRSASYENEVPDGQYSEDIVIDIRMIKKLCG